MWTRLFYLSTKEAFNSSFRDNKYMRRALSNRYQNMLKKQFRIQNVPWTYTPQLDDDKNPRHKHPKGKKFQRQRDQRVEKIMNNLKNVDEEMLKYRQDRLNKRKLTGYDYIIKQTAPSWINTKSQKIDNTKGPSWNQKK